MNLPNKLTLLRVILIPVFLVFFYVGGIPHNFLWALLVFAAASLTDMLDGQIARKRGLVTDFGILMDPLADKLLVMAAMVSFISVPIINPVIVIIILAREFLVTSIRLVAAGKGTVIAADKWGKMKTISQMIWICVGLLVLWMATSLNVAESVMNALWLVYNVLIIMVLVFTVISGVNYVVKNRQLFADA